MGQDTFFWEDKVKPIIQSHYKEKNKNIPSFISAQKFLNILLSKKVDLDETEVGGNNFLNHLSHEFFQKRHSYMNYFTTEEQVELIDTVLSKTHNPLHKNKHGEHFLWNISLLKINNFEKTDVDKYIKTYHINIHETNEYKETLLSRAIVNKDELLIKYYLEKKVDLGADPFYLFKDSNFGLESYHFPYTKQCFIELIKKERLFSQENIHLIHSWCQDYEKNIVPFEHIIYLLLVIQKTPLLYTAQDYTRIASFFEKVQEYCDSKKEKNSLLELRFEKVKEVCGQMQKKFLDDHLENKNLNRKIVKI